MHSPALIETMLKATGGKPVTYGGVTTYGHFEHLPGDVFGGEGRGLLTVVPTVRIADSRLPGIGTDPEAGTVEGVGRDIVVDYVGWTVSDIGPGDPGEILLLLTNPRSGD